MNLHSNPGSEKRDGTTQEKYTGHNPFGAEFPIDLTRNNLCLGFKDSIPYSEITGIYRKIKKNPKSKDYLDVFTGSPQWFRIYEPDQGLADSIIKRVTGAKKKTEHNNNGQQYTEDRILGIEKAIENKTILRDGTYCLSAGIIAEILKKRDKEVHPIGNKGIFRHRDENVLFATEHLLIGTDANEELKTIPAEDIALYVCKENVPSNGSGHKTTFTIYTAHIAGYSNKLTTNHSTFNNLDPKKVIKLMTS